jgi:hypothetical protein
VASLNRRHESERDATFASERFAVIERHVWLALGKNADVYAEATKALPRLNEFPRGILPPSFLERATLNDASLAALRLGRYSDAESTARRSLRLPVEASEGWDFSFMDQPDDSYWSQVLLGQALLGEERKDEALTAVLPAIAAYRDMQTRGASHVTFRQRFARALFVQALAEPTDDNGKARARESSNQAIAQLDLLTDEAKQLHDSKELFALIEAEGEKVGEKIKP